MYKWLVSDPVALNANRNSHNNVHVCLAL